MSLITSCYASTRHRPTNNIDWVSRRTESRWSQAVTDKLILDDNAGRDGVLASLLLGELDSSLALLGGNRGDSVLGRDPNVEC